MAAKRFFNDSSDSDQPSGKRMRTKPSFASVIGEVVMVNCLKNFCSALEPMLRKVVSEEVENGIQRGARSLTRSPSSRLQALEPPGPQPSSLQLIFNKKLSLPIFTGSKIVDIENSPLHILLVDKTCDHLVPISLPFPLKVEIVVLDGDFPAGGQETWMSDEFDKNVVKERTGKRPLLNGELQFTMRDGFGAFGEVEFTDNSSWIRSRKFRLGARVVQGSNQLGYRICEAMTEPFVVKDHRGELYKKHHPPMLEDEVWRLEKIGKDGAFHKKLTSKGVNTVQDFLKLSVVDPSKLRKILGIGMSEKMWEITLKHARTCIMGSKFYVFRGPNYALMLNPICQVIKAVINDEQTYPTTGITTLHKAYIENLVKEAYVNWNALEEVDGLLNVTPLLLTQGDVVDRHPNHHQQSIATSYHEQHLSITDGSMDMASTATNRNMECNDQWLVNSTLFSSPIDQTGAHCNFSESSSDDDLPHARLSIHHT